MTLLTKFTLSDRVLKNVEFDKEAHLQLNASKACLGVVLLQKRISVAYASRALADTEFNYPPFPEYLLANLMNARGFTII